MQAIRTWHLHINGQVQGVGFRPFVYALAQQFGLTGRVNNGVDGVHILFNADAAIANKFYQDVLGKAPPLSHITSHRLEEAPPLCFTAFTIAASSTEQNPLLLLSPDFGLCEECRKEMADKTNGRYQYPFTTCTQCGPRYSIIRQLPYDREHTTMAAFEKCAHCREEYHDPRNRRHFSQTNSCPHCAVVMTLYDQEKNVVEDDSVKIISTVCRLWESGKIVAVKGIGGYLLTCDATNETAVATLRKRKHRPAKPFALLFPDTTLLKQEVDLHEDDEKALLSPAAPIVLLYRKNGQSSLALSQIAPGLSTLGVMLPYTPLFQLLMQHFQKPMVATSGNISAAPIVFEDEAALSRLSGVADYILCHNRAIVAPQDDSVIAYSPVYRQRIVLRRSRGFAPFYRSENAALKTLLPRQTMLALGALLKSSFSLWHRGNVHISQFLGNTDNYDAQTAYEKTLHQFLHLFGAQPAVVLVDKHPGYFTSGLGQGLAKDRGCQLVQVQHHEAHFASVLGEHHLTEAAEPVLGVIWDGTGLGQDHHIWGGEFFVFQKKQFSRVACFLPFPHFLGDKMPAEPRLSFFSIGHGMEELWPLLQSKFSPAEWSNYRQLIKKSTLQTSSAGRLFDAVASLLGVLDKASYEGEAALLLEQLAQSYFAGSLHVPDAWLQPPVKDGTLSVAALVQEAAGQQSRGISRAETAAWFHVQLIAAIRQVAQQHHCRLICCSGGVFQNRLLTDLAIHLLGKEHRLYFNRQLSPNDENISFGQLIWYGLHHSLR